MAAALGAEGFSLNRAGLRDIGAVEAGVMRVLVAGTNRVCHTRLRAHGHDLVLFMPRGKSKPEDLAGPYEHVVALDDVAAVSLWAETARILHKNAPFDAVVAFNESTYALVRAISDYLGIPCVIDLDLFQRVLDKAAMRDLLSRHGIASCRYRLARGRNAIEAAIADVGLPCIVKPTDGEASRGVHKIASSDEVATIVNAIGAEQLDRGVLVEEFLEGEEISVEAISVGDRHHIVALTKKFKDAATFVERGHLVPGPIEESTKADVERYVRQVLDAFGFHDCPSHTELMLTAQGPRIIETHNRIGGDRIMDLILHATGVDMYDLVARQSIGEDITAVLPEQVVHQQSAVVWYADPSGPQTHRLREVRGADAVRALPYVRGFDLLRPPGSPAGPVRQSFDRSALVVVVGDTAREALDRAQRAIGMLEFEYAEPTDQVSHD